MNVTLKAASLACLNVLFSSSLFAQWTTSGNNIFSSNLGKVGIGTSNPAQKLTISGGLRVDDAGTFGGDLSVTDNANWLHFGTTTSGEGIGSIRTSGGINQFGLNFYTTSTLRMVIAPSTGNVGIGTATPGQKLTVNGGLRIDDANNFDGNLSVTDAAHWLNFGGTGSGEGIGCNRISGGINQFGLSFYTASTIRMAVTIGGNVLIGKTSQTNTAYKLDVSGYARADKLVVNTTGADFVFDSAYRLPSLNQVEAYVRLNHHLPDIAPAAEMQKEGLDVGENQTKLLQKVEELTLYLIEMKKENEELKARVEKLENAGKQ
jgi:hypothetical protein